jgi:cyclin B
MDSKSEINKSKRAKLYDWLIGVHTKYELSQQVIYLTMNVVDRFLAVNAVTNENLLLVGIGVMLITSKYEETQHLKVCIFPL